MCVCVKLDLFNRNLFENITMNSQLPLSFSVIRMQSYVVLQTKTDTLANIVDPDDGSPHPDLHSLSLCFVFLTSIPI